MRTGTPSASASSIDATASASPKSAGASSSIRRRAATGPISQYGDASSSRSRSRYAAAWGSSGTSGLRGDALPVVLADGLEDVEDTTDRPLVGPRRVRDPAGDLVPVPGPKQVLDLVDAEDE